MRAVKASNQILDTTTTAHYYTMTKLRVLAGPNANDLTPISHLVNTSKAHRIKSDRFDGLVTVHVKGFVGTDGKTTDSAYFDGEDRKGVTWSIQVTGRFLVDGLSSDDVLFGNTFDRPLKLPWGSGAALKFMKLVAFYTRVLLTDYWFSFVDPTLEHALDSEKPWALYVCGSSVREPHLTDALVDSGHL